jgi:L,D-transpeptidase catalytic domain
MRKGVAAIALAGAACVLVFVLGHRRSDSRAAVPVRSESFSAEAGRLPAPERPAFTVGRPKLLRRGETRARFAPVEHAVEARSESTPAAAVIAPLRQRTPEGTTNIVLVVGEATIGGRLWVHVRLPVLPNGRTGWVPRGSLGGYQFVHTHLVVDRSQLIATLFRDGRRVFTARVGIGTREAPTPAGTFYVRDRLDGFGDPFYGPVAFGTSARSAVLTDWPGGGFIGIHGTNEPALIPGRISHGCIRLRNQDIVRLSRLMPVGTPVTIR